MEFQITYGSGFGILVSDQFSMQGYYDHSSTSSNTLILDCERGELLKTGYAVVGKNGVSQAKSPQALKSHSDAERRRRKRINAHFSTLRGLIPSSTDKMDKAAILSEVIKQVMKLKKHAIDAASGLLIPLDTDEVVVQPLDDYQTSDETTLRFKASICCSYTPELFSDLKLLLNELQLLMEVTEMSTFEGRVKNEFVVSLSSDGKGRRLVDQNALASTIHRALTLVLDKVSPLQTCSPKRATQNKTRKLL